MITNHKTAEEIKQDDKFACGLEMDAISAYLLYRGGEKMEYYIIDEASKAVLFHGDDYRPSPLHCVDTMESVIDLLGFICCQPGDTDDGYFKDYTVAQMVWANSHTCEILKGEVSDLDNKYDPEFDSRAMFESRFVNAERLYITL